MAVPKKKRYKQIVTTRRTLFNTFLLKKKNVLITKFEGFVNLNNVNSTDFNRKSLINSFLHLDRFSN